MSNENKIDLRLLLADALEDNRRVNLFISDKVIPALTEATRAVRSSNEMLNYWQRKREIDEAVRLRTDHLNCNCSCHSGH